MTREQAMKEARRLSKTRMNKTWYVVYDDDQEKIYGEDNAWTICSESDYHRFYSNHIPVIVTNA